MRIQSNGLNIEVEEHGPKDGEPLLLIMGLGMQLIGWPDHFVELLADAGYRVIRFDNRDIGLSDKFEHWGRADLARAALRYTFRMKIEAPYLLTDMAQDALGVLDAMGIERCHIVGASMGGMISQIIAAQHPQRVRTLSLIMTTAGARRLPGPTVKARRALLSSPRDPRDMASVIEHSQRVFKVIESPAYPTPDEALRARLERSLGRSYYPQGIGRQLLAVVASGDRTPLLSRIQAPTLVIHGRADTLVPVANGIDLAKRIPGARLELIDGMNHDLPDALLPRLSGLIATHAAQSQTQGAAAA
jgi:pimeloyl-ACP methyl ester carboxylesterase